jgi:hypothetical protein
MGKPLILPSLHASTPDPAREPRRITKGLQQWFIGFSPVLTHLQLSVMCGLCHHILASTSQSWRHWGECPGAQPAESSIIQPVIKTPTGLEWIVGRQMPRIELRSGEMEWLRQFADVGPWLELGLRCDRCQSPLSGLNSDADQVYSVACTCREYIGTNREYRAPAKVSMH